MACLNDCPKFDSTKNNYYTTKKMWENIIHLIPTDKIIYEAFLLNSKSKSIDYLTELGLNIVGDNKLNFLTDTLPTYDIIISNPPFETNTKKKILEKLYELDKPFILILPSSKMTCSYIRDNYKDSKLQIIVPRKRIQFIKLVNGKVPEDYKSKCNFDCFYFAYKMNFEKDITWLE